MKRFITTLCFVAFLTTGLSSCADSADDVTPNFLEQEANDGTQTPSPKTRP